MDPGSALADVDMVALLLLPLLWGGEWAGGGGAARVGEGPQLQRSLCVPQGPCRTTKGTSSECRTQ